MKEIKDDPQEVFNEEDFEKLLQNLKKKNKEKYQFILTAGSDYLRIFYNLFERPGRQKANQSYGRKL